MFGIDANCFSSDMSTQTPVLETGVFDDFTIESKGLLST